MAALMVDIGPIFMVNRWCLSLTHTIRVNP